MRPLLGTIVSVSDRPVPSRVPVLFHRDRDRVGCNCVVGLGTKLVRAVFVWVNNLDYPKAAGRDDDARVPRVPTSKKASYFLLCFNSLLVARNMVKYGLAARWAQSNTPYGNTILVLMGT